MKLFELFKDKVAWEWLHDDRDGKTAQFRIGDKVYVYNARSMNADTEPPGDWEIDYTLHRVGTELMNPKDSYGTTGTGDEYKVMGTIIDITRDFVSKYKPTSVYFTATKYKDDPDEKKTSGTKSSRAGVYTRLINRLASSLGYTAKVEDVPSKITFELTKVDK